MSDARAAGDRAGRAAIVVRDCGPGVPPEALDRLFDRLIFVQT